MTINGINGANTQTAQMGMNQAMDSYSKNIQNQIANAQNQLQELSSNEGMTPEEKMKKRQEIQQQISDLNMQLRQHQMEQRRAERSEKQQAKGSSMDEMPGGTNAKTGSKRAGLSQTSMTAMISADASIKQAKAQGSVATKMEGRAGVLKSEIKLDEARGGDATKKKEELADVEQTAMQATASQMETLGDANKAMEEAAEAERTEQKASGSKEENKEQAEGKTAGKAADSDAKGEAVQDGISAGAQADSTESVQPDNNTQAQDTQAAQTAVTEAQAAVYTHVDVRL